MPTSPSLMQLPVSSRARALRLGAVLVFDLGLALAGAGLLLSYLNARAAARAPLAAAPAAPLAADAGGVSAPLQPDVQVDTPRVVHKGDKPRPTGPGPVKPPPRAPIDASVPPPVIVPAGPPDAAPEDVPPPPPPPPAPDAAVAAVALADAAPGEPAPIEGDPTADEQTLANGVQRTVEQHMPQVRACWVNIAKQTGEATAPQGKIEIEFAVTGAGDAQGIRVVENGTGSDALGDCIVSLVQAWKFPSHAGDPVVFVWPFLFRTAR